MRHMRNQKIKRCIVLAFLLCCMGSVAVKAGQSNGAQISGRVLYISSYSCAWEPTVQQIEGIREVLGENVVLDYKFMDTKHVDTAEGEQLFYESISYYLKQMPPYDAVIVGDDAAFQFAMQHQQELFFEIPIIFEGVNQVDEGIAAGRKPYVTGIVERLSYGNTIEMAHRMYPEATQVVAILDDTATGKGGRAEFYKYDDVFPELKFLEINASELSQEELLAQVSALGGESILLFIMCSESADGAVYASAESVPLLAECAKIPIFSVMPIGMGKGTLGGEVVSHRQMGEMAGDMVMQILSGTECASIPVAEQPPRIYFFDEIVMNRFGITADMLPAKAEILNHRETFWERNKTAVEIALVIAALLLFLIIILAMDNVRRRKMNIIISETNEKLAQTARYDVLTGIHNRRVFMEDTEQMIAAGNAFGILMYDIDNFKQINDMYGHNEGDAILKELARRAGQLADERFCVYRLAGDEFTAIVKSGEQEVVEEYMKRLYDSLQEPYELGGSWRGIYTSIGAAMWPADGASGSEVIASADAAMYHVKKNGKNGRSFYENGMK